MPARQLCQQLGVTSMVIVLSMQKGVAEVLRWSPDSRNRAAAKRIATVTNVALHSCLKARVAGSSCLASPWGRRRFARLCSRR
jgi:hypothetical protein